MYTVTATYSAIACPTITRVQTFKRIKVAQHFAALADSAVILDEDGDIVPNLEMKVKKWSAPKRKSADKRTYRVWRKKGESLTVSERENGFGYYFKGYWHGAYDSVESATRAWLARPVIGAQGVTMPTIEDDFSGLDMAMF